MRRLFWMALGVGLGIAAAVQISKMLKDGTVGSASGARGPATASRVGGLVGTLAERGRLAIAEGLAEMRAREREIRSELGI